MWEVYSWGALPYPYLSNSDTIDYVLKGNRLEKPTECPQEVTIMKNIIWNNLFN